ncbi:hypothetical protein [Gracilibacillus alcaliphilus]|uniref:hypothetical protein n=1 Tax=Gracilibacillus alcaliphilus TaxID=1401441 RepID=UPI00195AC960|nr:hypothetical protein [Gracilibacillus alcaliphilus]MBM7675276.1 putative membrane protein [Gracilibacillus alcaliphilus]
MHKMLTGSCTIMIFISWTILILRMNDWALQSPIAERMILSYAIVMIFSGIFTVFTYIKADRNILMKVCLLINGLYAIVGTAAVFLIVAT